MFSFGFIGGKSGVAPHTPGTNTWIGFIGGRTTRNTLPVLFGTCTMKSSGGIRLGILAKTDGNNNTYVQVRKNGVILTTLTYTTSSYVNQDYDITGLAPNDVITLWLYSSSPYWASFLGTAVVKIAENTALYTSPEIS